MARDKDLDLLKAIRLLAYGAVTRKDTDYLQRFICRWYAREFHRDPMDVLNDIPFEDVLQHFFECQYERLEDHDLEEVAEKLLETQAERLVREEKEKRDKVDDDEFYRQTVAKAKALKEPSSHNLDKKKYEDLAPAIPVSVMGTTKPTTFNEIKPEDKKLAEIPEGIHMEFAKPGELDDMEDWDITGPPKLK